MKSLLKFQLYILILAFKTSNALGQPSQDYLRCVVDTTKDEYAYINLKGDTIIPFGKYLICYTNNFTKFAIVSSKDKGLIGIDRNENILFKVYVFDNGPDYPSDGLFRIIENGKIGYADTNGNIVIKSQFDCAYPFQNGKAKAGKGCKKQTDGDHSWWTDGKWFTINKKGKAIRT